VDRRRQAPQRSRASDGACTGVLRRETILWLTTVDRRGVPQPRPAWFHWDGRTVPVSGEPDAATILRGPPSAARVRADLGKYRLGLRDPEMSAERFRAQR
jgi:hypothetical protein